MRETVARFGRLDGVANLSGSGKFVALTDSSLEDFRQNIEGFAITNYNLMMPALRQMLAQDAPPRARSRGRLITVTAGSSRTLRSHGSSQSGREHVHARYCARA